jgi:hypothetical protein
LKARAKSAANKGLVEVFRNLDEHVRQLRPPASGWSSSSREPERVLVKASYDRRHLDLPKTVSIDVLRQTRGHLSGEGSTFVVLFPVGDERCQRVRFDRGASGRKSLGSSPSVCDSTVKSGVTTGMRESKDLKPAFAPSSAQPLEAG